MPGYLGEYSVNERIDDDITMVVSDGTPTAVTSGSVCVRKRSGSALAPAGAVLSNSGGLHHVIIFTASASTFYTLGDQYCTFFGNGTLTTTSVIGYVINTFRISNPATAGYVSVDWATTTGTATLNSNIQNVRGIGSKGTAGYMGLDWANTTGTATVQATVTATGFDWSAVTGTATVNANVQNVRGVGSKGTAGYMGLDWAATTGTATINSDLSSVATVAQVSDGIWDEARSGHTTAGTYGEAVTGVINTTSANVKQILGVTSAGTAGYVGIDWAATTGTTFVKAVTTTSGFDWAAVTGTATLNANVQNIRGAGSKGTAGYVGTDWANTTGTAQVNTAVSSLDWTAFTGTATLNANLQNIKGSGSAGAAGYVGRDWAASTGTATINAHVGSMTTNVVSASVLAQGAAQEIADEVLNRDIAGGGSGGARIVRDAFRAIRNRTIVTTTGQLIVYAEDDTATAWTAVTTTVAANSLASVDPA